MSFVVRPARPEEAEALPEIERDAGRSFLAIPDLAWIAGDQVMSAEAHAAAIAAGALWVAEDSRGVPIGFLNAERFSDALHIWEMAVRRDRQGKGAGAQLIAAAVNHARNEGVSAVTLTTFRDVPWNAPFYAKRGFRILGAAELGERLKNILRLESEAGLPAERRCAMLKTVAVDTVVQPSS
jgi:GNAT superfamily N-acetyltransferase